jgi:hypothetical protein
VFAGGCIVTAAPTPTRDLWANFRLRDLGRQKVPHLCLACPPALASSILSELGSLDYNMDWEPVSEGICGIVHPTVTIPSLVPEILWEFPPWNYAKR